eukprot:TRINITY_DN64625_c0_g1_i1.p1 TRINITY_DN64625_c0_g1~~TRINITY_DN64625_c0_g1_i1.p1  ORF type:complete len:295 (-),score=50.80 TRINITY_DN64625_c0_g1_i1:52-864(-)
MAVDHLDSVTAESGPKRRVSRPRRSLRSGVCRRLPPIPTAAPASVAGRRVLRLLGSLCHSGKPPTSAVSCPEASLGLGYTAFAADASADAAADAAADAHALRTVLNDPSLWEAPPLGCCSGLDSARHRNLDSAEGVRHTAPSEICVTSPLSSSFSSEFSFGLEDWHAKAELQQHHEVVLLSPGSSPRSSHMESDFGLAEWQLEEVATRKAELPLLEHWQAQRWRAKADRMTHAALAVMEKACALACLEQSFRAWRCTTSSSHQSEIAALA